MDTNIHFTTKKTKNYFLYWGISDFAIADLQQQHYSISNHSICNSSFIADFRFSILIYRYQPVLFKSAITQ